MRGKTHTFNFYITDISISFTMKHLRKLFGVYRAVLYTHPVYTQALQSSFLMGVGDVLSQTVFEDKGIKNIDKGRVIRFAGIGFFFMVSIKVSYISVE